MSDTVNAHRTLTASEVPSRDAFRTAARSFRLPLSGGHRPVLVLAGFLISFLPLRADAFEAIRVDSAAVPVPADLERDWDWVLSRTDWTDQTGKPVALGTDPKFTSFRARHHRIHRESTGGMALTTTWFAGSKCRQETRNLDSLPARDRQSLEIALDQPLNGSSPEMESLTVYGQFEATGGPTAVHPLNALSDHDQEELRPFAALVRDSVLARMSSSSSCGKDKEKPERERRRSSSGTSRSASLTRSSGNSGRVATGGGRSGSGQNNAGGDGQGSGEESTELDGDSQAINQMGANLDGAADGASGGAGGPQKVAFLVEKFQSQGGSLSFGKVGDFIVCITTDNPSLTYQGLLGKYRPTIAPGKGARVSWRVSFATDATCENPDLNLTSEDGNLTSAGANLTPDDVPASDLTTSVAGPRTPSQNVPAPRDMEPTPDPIGDRPSPSAPGDPFDSMPFPDHPLEPVSTDTTAPPGDSGTTPGGGGDALDGSGAAPPV